MLGMWSYPDLCQNSLALAFSSLLWWLQQSHMPRSSLLLWYRGISLQMLAVFVSPDRRPQKRGYSDEFILQYFTAGVRTTAGTKSGVVSPSSHCHARVHLQAVVASSSTFCHLDQTCQHFPRKQYSDAGLHASHQDGGLHCWWSAASSKSWNNLTSGIELF